MRRKPLPVSLSKKERKDLEKIQRLFEKKTLASTVRAMIQFIANLGPHHDQ